MAEMKIAVQKQRKDGFWPVYIRVTHQRKVAYVNTGKLAAASYVDEAGQVNDPYLMNMLGDRIIKWMEALNHVDITKWNVKEVVDYVVNISQQVNFSEYARIYVRRLVNEDRERTAKNYRLSVQHLELYMGKNNVMFEELTSTVLTAWIDTLKRTKRAKEMYPVCIRQIWKDAMRQLNDGDKGVMLIKTYPWDKIDIPHSDETEHKAQRPMMLRRFFSVPIPESRMKVPLAQLAQDVCKISFCLAGMNSVDLYHLKKEDYYDGVIHYHRRKTRGSRGDSAYMEMRVPDMIKPLFEEYKAKESSEYLLNFAERLRSSDSFSANVNKGIDQVCQLIGLKKGEYWDYYTFRHSWGTIARNDIGAHTEDVAFAMNHGSAHRVTEIYVKKDYSKAWKLNEKVMEFIFLSDDPGKEETMREKLLETDRISKYNEMAGTAYYMGKAVAEKHGNGYTNKKQIIGELIEMLPEFIPLRAKVQFVIENKDKGEKWMYEHQKGKGFC